MQYSWSKISLWSTEKWNYFGFNQFGNVIFRILEIQYVTYALLNFKDKDTLWF